MSSRIIAQKCTHLTKISPPLMLFRCTDQVLPPTPPPPTPKSLWKPWGWGKLLPNSQKFAHFPQQKNPLIDLQNPTQQPKIYSFSATEKSPLIYLHLSLSKVPFLPPSNSNFYVSTLWLQLQSFLFNFSLYVHICHANFD